MSKDLNQCNFIGRLGRDVDIRYTPSGNAVASFSIACSDDYNDKQTGQKVEKTNWISITAFGKLGEICGEYLTKGSQVFVSGKQETDKYTDKQGVEKYSTKIIANELQMLGGKPSENTGSQQQAQQEPKKPDNAQSSAMVEDEFDDDIPF